MDEIAVKKEHKRLEEILERADIPQRQRDILAPVIDAMAWQRVKLDETMDLIEETQVVCKYDNGGGQSGIHQNPAYKGYLELWRGYMLGLEKFSSYLPKDLQEETAGASISVLEQVRQMKKAKV